ncbi:DUF4747 family protein [Halorubrum terrestre]|uniref:DUF4747 family protein n=1 Tax=Halorubrum distributum TaxID=29283 RepID=A0A6B1IHJ5_9EURY|nr:DUF4747 family protein [Halorubrum terrestre]MYL18168.1 DUF4747 family protein [Halorubrum terrestre]
MYSVFEDFFDQKEAVVETSDGGWYFGRVDAEASQFFGKFGRVYSDEPTIYDDQKGDFVQLGSEMTDADYSVFMLDLSEGFIAHSSTYRVRNKNFIKYFQKAFDKHSSGTLTIELQPVKNEKEIGEVISEYPVYELEADLHPSNPGPEPAWEDLDESMREMLVNKLGISAERFEKEGINMEEGFISQVAEMAETKYGDSWKVVYVDERQELQVITDGEDPVTKKIDGEIDTVGGVKANLSDLANKVKTFL